MIKHVGDMAWFSWQNLREHGWLLPPLYVDKRWKSWCSATIPIKKNTNETNYPCTSWFGPLNKWTSLSPGTFFFKGSPMIAGFIPNPAGVWNVTSFKLKFSDSKSSQSFTTSCRWKKTQSQMSQGHTSICRLSCNIIYDTNPSYFMACSCLSLMDFQLYLGSFSISTPSPAWIAAARGKARGFAGEARSLLASEKNLLITPPKTIKNAQGFAGMVDPRTRPVISRFPYVYIYIYVCVWELVKVGICLLQMLAQFKFDYR